jgi:hypothetical protein
MGHMYNATTREAQQALDEYEGILAKYDRSAYSYVNTSATWLYRLWIFNFWVHLVSIVNQLTLSSPNAFLIFNCLWVCLATVMIFANREDHKVLQAKKRFEKLEAKGELRKLPSGLMNLWENRCIEAGIRPNDDSVQLSKFPALVDAMITANEDIDKVRELHKDDERHRLTNAIHRTLTESMDAVLESAVEAKEQLETAERLVLEANQADLETDLRRRYTI